MDWQPPEEGRLESSGQFTLDPEAARAKLAQYLLAEPGLYILKLVQWAVAAGARQIWVKVDSKRVSVIHDGRSLERPELDTFLIDASDRSRWHLSLGLNAAQSLNPRQIIIESATWIWRHEEGGGEVSEERPDDSLTRLTLVGIRPRRVWRSTLKQFRHVLQVDLGNMWGDLMAIFGRSEVALLRSHCQYCPVPVRVNGHFVNRPDSGRATRHDDQGLGPRSLTDGYRWIRMYILSEEGDPSSIPVPQAAWKAPSYWYEARCLEGLEGAQCGPSEGSPGRLTLDFQPVPLCWNGLPMAAGQSMAVLFPPPAVTRPIFYCVSDGVLIDQFIGLERTRLSRVVMAYQGKTDLTGLAPVWNDGQKAELETRLAALGQRCFERLDLFWRRELRSRGGYAVEIPEDQE